GYEEFLMGTTIAVVGSFTVLAWNTLLPERRDSLVLGPLPIRLRTIFLAKSLAIATALGGSIVAVNLFSGMLYPVALAPNSSGLAGIWQPWTSFWISIAGAGIFIFCLL